MTSDHPILAGAQWENANGKHAGRLAEIVRFNGHSVFFRYLKGTARAWDGRKAGQVMSIGENVFRQQFTPLRKSGGGSVHDAPLPPAALRAPIDEGKELELAVTTAPANGVPAVPAEVEPWLYPTSVNTPHHKICDTCFKNKPEDAYARSREKGNPLRTTCRECIEAARIERVRASMATAHTSGRMREATQARLAAMPDETKHEIMELRAAGVAMFEIMRTYRLNTAMYGALIKEMTEPATTGDTIFIAPANLTPEPVSVPVVTTAPVMATSSLTLPPVFVPAVKTGSVMASGGKWFDVTYTVTRTVTDSIYAESMAEALKVALAADGIGEVTEIKVAK